jgi:hypothetical protein
MSGSSTASSTTPTRLRRSTAVASHGRGQRRRHRSVARPIRWERRGDIHEAFLELACCLTTHRQLGSLSEPLSVRRKRIRSVRRDSRATIWARWRGAVRLGAGRFGLRRPSSVRLTVAVAQIGPALGRREDLREVATLDVRALPTRERTSGHAAASVGRGDIRLGQTARTRRATASREACQFQWTAEDEGEESSPRHCQRIARWGACRKARVTAQNRRPMPQPAEMGARHACLGVDVWGPRRRRTSEGTGGACAGARRAGAWGCAARLGRADGRRVRGKATRDEDVLDKSLDRVGGTGGSIGHRGATDHSCLGVSR